MSINFEHAEWLLSLGVILPLAWFMYWVGFRGRMAARQRYGESRLVDRYTKPWSRRADLLNVVTWTVMLTLLVVAASGPYKSEAPDQIAAGSTQVIIVTDVSKSMAAEDYRQAMPGDNSGQTEVIGPWGSRLDMTKAQIEFIMQAVRGNMVGVVTYTGEGFPQADLTADFTALRFVLKNWVNVGSAPGGGSDFARGLKEALATFQRDEDPNKQRVIVLFSDGGFTGDQAELNEVAAEIAKAKIRLIIVGLGSRSPVPIPVYDGQTLKGYVTEKDQFVTTSIEEATLQQLAVATGGDYFYLEPGKTELGIQWSTAMGGTRVEPQAKRLHAWFLGVAIALLFVLSLTGLSRKRDVL